MKNRMLYERCWLCAGTLVTTSPAMVDGPERRGPLPAGSPCPGCVGSPTPGWCEVGVTGGQLENLVAERDRLLLALDELVKLQAHYAGLLNQLDGGKRQAFASSQEWIDRLEELKKIPAKG